MTAIPHSGSRGLSDRIVQPLRLVAARHWKIAAARGVLQTLCAALSVLLVAALLLGSVSAMPAALRIALAGLAWGSVAFAAVRFLRPAVRRRTLADAAALVEQRTAGLDERLSSTVELSTESEPFAGSPPLRRHLARQAEADAAGTRPDKIVPDDSVRRWALLLAPVVLLWLTLTVALPRPMLAGVYRTLMPWRGGLPAALAQIAVGPGDVTIAEGDSLEIRATVNGRGNGGRSESALLLTQPLETSEDSRPLAHDLLSISAREFRATLDNLRQSFRYQVSTPAGDSPWFTATVLPRPSVAALDVRYDYPAYSGMDARLVPNSDGSLRALQGTEVTLTVHAGDALDLAPGRSRISVTEGSRQRTLEFKPAPGQANVYEARVTVFNSGSYRIHLVNGHGLANKDDQPRPIVADMDQPPKIAITAPQSQVSVRPDDDVPVRFAASDDFGVASVRAVVQVDDKAPSEAEVRLSAPDRRRFEGEYV